MDAYWKENSHEEATRPVPTTTEEDDIPACQSCRKRKLKCSRERPSCSQCSRLRCECLYLLKQKPGIQSGAVNNLNKRLEFLECLLLDVSGSRKPQLAFLDLEASSDSGSAEDRASNISFKSNGAQLPSIHQIDHLTEISSPASSRGNSLGKRKHRSGDIEGSSLKLGNWNMDGVLPPLPSPRLLQAIVTMHFQKVHHWAPILHQKRFQEKLENLDERRELELLLHGLVSASIKYVKVEDFGVTQAEMERQICVSRNAVILKAMEIPSVENLQALVLVAFDLMAGGQITKAWSIIGSLTRTVEYLQLTIEPDEIQRNLLLRPLILLDASRDWTDSEERRRLFWNVFLLDRWNTSLTSDEVHRRLPCNGGSWAREEPVLTPYFGIWNKSAAKIGNSIAYVPTLYTSPKYSDQGAGESPGAKSGITEVDASKLGAFAYCIEATESLSQVTSFFLQQLIDFKDRHDVGSWLTRFKELDLRLVHWKMFLPQQWKDSNVSRDVSVINMDPNLTLAHITHNTSMILLHQHIAYPSVDWAGLIALPSSCSAETCQLAATETASITQKYLQYMGGIVNCQFAFCIFIAARIILVHWRINNTDLAPEFFSLVESLQKVSRVWQGYQSPHGNQGPGASKVPHDIAADYASQLQELHAKCMSDGNFGRDMLGYSDSIPNSNFGGLLPPLGIPTSRNGSQARQDQRNLRESPLDESPRNHTNRSHYPTEERISTTSNLNTQLGYPGPQKSMPAPESGTSPSEPPFSYGSLHAGMTQMPSPSHNMANSSFQEMPSNNVWNGGLIVENAEDGLTAMSNILLSQQFLEMDRVITLDGTDFNYYGMHNS
ncbi:putative transcriptional regulatory [Hyphodiscus hymeniophilus]|uniref:Transcriptional regulatory n=1 Tax=Hyphodiscus hymeniophilus TaxID=353542 RepID=A0A9P6SPI2_9HELO|nr:putative transcriptional regulatory [Hyphodiscus hymeniophilus]